VISLLWQLKVCGEQTRLPTKIFAPEGKWSAARVSNRAASPIIRQKKLPTKNDAPINRCGEMVRHQNT
jgi:hypothetical protein